MCDPTILKTHVLITSSYVFFVSIFFFSLFYIFNSIWAKTNIFTDNMNNFCLYLHGFNKTLFIGNSSLSTYWKSLVGLNVYAEEIDDLKVTLLATVKRRYTGNCPHSVLDVIWPFLFILPVPWFWSECNTWLWHVCTKPFLSFNSQLK